MGTLSLITRNYSITAFICALLLFTSCKKDEATNGTVSETTPVTGATSTVAVPSAATVYELGTGTGDLVIDGSTLKLAANAFIKIKAGTYKNITIKNILSAAATPTLIKNDGIVNITNAMATDNISNVTIAGDNTSGVTYGFKFANISYMAMTMNGKMDGVTLKSMSFINIGNYAISGQTTNGSGLAYTGTEATRTDNFKILNCFFENAGSIVFGGKISSISGTDNGLFKTVEIASNIFQNSPGVGSVCEFTNVQDYDVHNNTVNNVNQSTNNHNGVFSMMGNGKFHDNKCTNYQGNSIRMWLFSRGSTPVTTEIYNNVCYNTRKYSGFELQGFDEFIYTGKTTYANAKVYNNTVGTMNTSKDWEGQVLDLYNYNGGTLSYYNNLGFNLNTNAYFGMTDMINNNSQVKITESNNTYVALQANAVVDLTHFVSKVTGVGATGF